MWSLGLSLTALKIKEHWQKFRHPIDLFTKDVFSAFFSGVRNRRKVIFYACFELNLQLICVPFFNIIFKTHNW